MFKQHFTTIAIALSIVCIASSFINSWPPVWQVTLCGIMIVAMGIPHGAIDHVLFLTDSSVTKKYFYSFYLGMMVLGLGLWLLSPVLAFALFLMLSAFHFGQSQFIAYTFNKTLKNIIYMTWGLSILLGLVLYKQAELNSLVQQFPDLAPLSYSTNHFLIKGLAIASTAITLFLLVFLVITRKVTVQDFLSEIILMGLLHSVFYLLPFLVGFTLYFTVFHSLNVLEQEYKVLRQRLSFFSVQKFLLMLTPYTLLSLIGLAIGIWASSEGWIPVSHYLLLIVFISILTVPHSIVMDMFYKRDGERLAH